MKSTSPATGFLVLGNDRWQPSCDRTSTIDPAEHSYSEWKRSLPAEPARLAPPMPVKEGMKIWDPKKFERTGRKASPRNLTHLTRLLEQYIALTKNPKLATDFILNLYKLSESKLDRRASDLVIDFFEDTPETEIAIHGNEALQVIETDKLSTIVLLAILAVTFPLSNVLPERKNFFTRAFHSIESRDGLNKAHSLTARYK